MRGTFEAEDVEAMDTLGRDIATELSSHAPTNARSMAAGLAVEAFADVASLSVILSAAIVVPIIFSVAQSDVFALPKTFAAVTLAVVLLALLTSQLLAKGVGNQLRPTGIAVAVGAFVAWNVVAWWFAQDRAHALLGERLQLQGLVTNLAYGLFFLAGARTIRSTWRMTILVVALAVGGVAVVGYGLAQRAGLDPIWSSLPEDRIVSTLGQANALSAYLVILVPLVLALAVGRNRAIKLAVLAFAGLALLTLAFSMSRGGYVAIAIVGLVALGCTLAWRRDALRRRELVPALVILLAAGFALATVPAVRSVAERVGARALLATDLSEGSTRIKLDLWTASLAIAADHPVDGVGQDGFVLVFPDYRDEVLPAERAAHLAGFRPESPHNVYLGILTGAGVPALASYLAIVGLVGARIMRLLRSTADRRTWFFGAAIASAIAGHLVTDMFVTAETTASMLFWILLGVGAGMRAPDSADAAPPAPEPLESASSARRAAATLTRGVLPD